MHLRLQKEEGWFIPDKENSLLLSGDVSFIYQEGKFMFDMTSNGEVAKSKEVKSIPVFLHKDCSFSLTTHTWYFAKGEVYLNRNMKAAFFLPKEILAESPPRILEVEGTFLKIKGSGNSLFRLFKNKFLPLSEKGLIIFKDPRESFIFEDNFKYFIKGKIFIPSQGGTGFLILSFVEQFLINKL